MSDFHIRPCVASFAPYQAGLSVDAIREKYGLERVIKLASNENPLGTSPVVQKVLRDRAGMAFRYPAAGNPRLVKALGEACGVDPARIVVGNGSDEIIDLLFRVCAEPGRHNVVTFDPCFGIYVTQARLCGVELRQARLNPDFSFPWADLLRLVDADTAMVLVTTPDNPSGYTSPVADLALLAQALPASCLLVIDEAYMDFTDDEAAFSLLSRLNEFPNVAISRTFSKSRALAGMRIGYVLLPPSLAEYMWRVRLPFSVNILAEEAAIAALQDETFHQETRRVVQEGRRFLAQELAKLGFGVHPSQANFLMLEVPPRVESGNALFEALLQRGFIVRPLASYSLPRHLRVTVGTEEENALFVATVKDLVRS